MEEEKELEPHREIKKSAKANGKLPDTETKKPQFEDIPPQKGPRPVKGLQNHPNSCFMNSVIQLILNSPLLKTLQVATKPLGFALASLAVQYQYSQVEALLVHDLKDSLNNEYPGLYQHIYTYDATQFFNTLGEKLDKSLEEAFMGQKLTVLNCSNCGFANEVLQEYKCITIGPEDLYEFPFKNKIPLHKHLTSDVHTLFCHYCGEHTCFVTTEYLKLPDALLFEVSRARPILGKCHKYAFFDEYFTAKDKIGTNQYKLSGVVYHKGLLQQGHYTCKVRGSNGQFYYIDQQLVEESHLQNRSATVTMVLYHRVQE